MYVSTAPQCCNWMPKPVGDKSEVLSKFWHWLFTAHSSCPLMTGKLYTLCILMHSDSVVRHTSCVDFFYLQIWTLVACKVLSFESMLFVQAGLTGTVLIVLCSFVSFTTETKIVSVKITKSLISRDLQWGPNLSCIHYCVCLSVCIHLAGHSWLRLCNHQQRLHPYTPWSAATCEY